MFASFDKCIEENNEKKYIKGSKYVEPALHSLQKGITVVGCGI